MKGIMTKDKNVFVTVVAEIYTQIINDDISLRPLYFIQ